jgi:signal transduction histidine kinase
MKSDIDWENDKDRIAEPRVLVVDDEPLILRNLDVLLTKKGCRVTTASTGVEGLAKARENPPDAILLDVVMPDMDGYQVCRRLKAEPALQHIPVLLITALNDVFSKVKGLDAGADDFISKPFNEAELRARLWAHLRNKHLHDQLEASFHRLKELEEMKESLTHMIMHDVSSPLTAVHFGLEATLEALDAGNAFSPSHERMLRTAMIACRRVIDMLRDVLMVQRLEEKKFPLQPALINLADVTSRCLSFLEPSGAAAGVTMRAEIDPSVPAVMADEALLTRVIMNLVANGLKFTPRGGHVSVIFHRASDAEVEGQVTDDGIGIPANQLTRIFDKYVQAQGHHARAGVGLGLTFCRYAIEAHGGRIWAENNATNGSRFIFRLPVRPLESSENRISALKQIQ